MAIIVKVGLILTVIVLAITGTLTVIDYWRHPIEPKPKRRKPWELQ